MSRGWIWLDGRDRKRILAVWGRSLFVEGFIIGFKLGGGIWDNKRGDRGDRVM